MPQQEFQNLPFLYKADDTIEPVLPKNGKKFTLEEMQALVGGYVSVFTVGHNMKMAMDEDGKLAGKSINRIATLLLRTAYPGSIDTVVGDVVIYPKSFFS